MTQQWPLTVVRSIAIATLMYFVVGPNTQSRSVLAARGSAGGYLGQHHLRSAPSLPAFVFGNTGGLAHAITVTITDDNVVLVRGTLHPQRFRVPPNTAHGLVRLAEAEGFFSMPHQLFCASPSPAPSGDTTTDFITLYTTAGARTVYAPGACGSGFAQLFDVLTAVARYSI